MTLDDATRGRALAARERWEREGRLETVRDRLFGAAATAVVLIAILAAVPNRGAVTSLVVGLAQAAGAGIALAAYSVRTAVEDPETLREAGFEDEFVVALGFYALGTLSGAALRGGPALAAWRLLFQETPEDSERGGGWNSPDRDAGAWSRWLTGGAVLVAGVVILEQVSAVVGLDWVVGVLSGVGRAPSLPELGAGGTVALLVGAVVLGAIIGLGLALARS